LSSGTEGVLGRPKSSLAARASFPVYVICIDHGRRRARLGAVLYKSRGAFRDTAIPRGIPHSAGAQEVKCAARRHSGLYAAALHPVTRAYVEDRTAQMQLYSFFTVPELHSRCARAATARADGISSLFRANERLERTSERTNERSLLRIYINIYTYIEFASSCQAHGDVHRATRFQTGDEVTQPGCVRRISRSSSFESE